MKLNSVMITNYRYYRGIFEGDKESEFVINNLHNAIAEDIKEDETAHINLQYWVHYDEEGLAGFEVTQARFAHDKAYINVQFISTAK